jgi:hypothetical protein
MDLAKAETSCPKCLSRESPILVVWGTGIASGELNLQCRTCQHQWSSEPLPNRQAS